MFCPRCGQQAAEEVRFCSRCGLPLDAAAELVEADGNPDWHLARAEASGGALTPRQRGTRKGLMLIVGGLIFFGVAILLTIGVMRMLYALLLEEHRADGKSSKRVAAAPADSAPELGRGSARRRELPDARTVPASLYAKAPADTSDMSASTLSVTEGTTRLLDEDREGGRR